MSSEKEKFAERLNNVLDEAGFPKQGHGRQTALADLLEISPSIVGEWLRGDEFPKTSKLVKIAEYVGVRSNWLLSGAGQKVMTEADREELKLSIQARREERQFSIGSGEAANQSQGLLTQEAFDVAVLWMRLPVQQQQAMRKAIEELVNIKN